MSGLKVYFDIKLTRSQQNIYDLAHDPKYKFITLVLSRQQGKTTSMMILVMEWLLEKIWKLILIIGSMGVVVLLFKFIEFLGEMENLVTVYNIICNWLGKMSAVFWIVIVAGCITMVSVLVADRACTKAVGQQNDHIVFLMPSIGRLVFLRTSLAETE